MPENINVKNQKGNIDQMGQVIYSWKLTVGKSELDIFLRYKKISLIVAFLFFITLYSYLFYLLFHSIIGIYFSFLLSIVSLFLYIFMFWLASKINLDLKEYQISTEGTYIHLILPGIGPLTGLFVPYSNLEKPIFDEKNNLIILKFKNRRFLRRFIVCM